jgi:flagellar biosynthesis chaperone FliJ
MPPLQNLKDIHSPDVVGIWPLAYGWWILSAIILIVMILAIKWLFNAHKKQIIKRQALVELREIPHDQVNNIAQLNQLLKRAAMGYFPKSYIQKMYGQEWTSFLIETFPSKKNQVFSTQISALQNALYQQSDSQNSDFSAHQTAVQSWLKLALPPGKKILQKLEQKYA